MRPTVKGGLCSAVWVAAWGSILLSLYLGQIFVSLLEEITHVESLDAGLQDYDTYDTMLFYWSITTVLPALPVPVP